MPLDDHIYSPIEKRAECNNGNLGDRTPPEPTLSLDEPEQRCQFQTTPPLWMLGRVANGTRRYGSPVDEVRLYLFSICMQARSLLALFVYRSLCLYACLIVYISHEFLFTNECMYAFQR